MAATPAKTDSAPALGMPRKLALGFDEALVRIPDALRREGFGVLTEIDVKDTLHHKIGVEFRRYRILGACNPTLAHEALSAELGAGVMMPCNVIVYEDDDERAVVIAVDPTQSAAAHSETLAPIAAEVRERLGRVVDSLAG
jgi:uncharacterized protein (DUF302 family)